MREGRGETHGGLKVTINVPRSTVNRGASLSVQLAVVNEGRRDVAVRFTSSQRFDLVVKDLSGRQIIKWSDNMVFAQLIKDMRLEQGGRIEGELVWEANVAPGNYTIFGSTPRMLVEGRPIILESPAIIVQVR